MTIFQLIQHGLVWGLIFGVIFCAATLMIGKVNVEMLLHDYPPDIQKRYGSMSPQTRKQAKWASLPLLAILFLVVVLGLGQLRISDGELRFLNTIIATTIMFQVWNLIDLLILDWFILMTLRPRFMILPGTEGLDGYQNYRFHFQKFIKGILFTFILSLVVTSLTLILEMLI